MDLNQTQNFLLAFTAEINRSYESPVILLTMKDYAENIVNSLLEMRSALIQRPDISQVIDIINTLHLEWLQAVKDIEVFKKRAQDTPREHITNAIEFSIQRASKRSKKWQKILKEMLPVPTSPENAKTLQNEIETLSQTHKNLKSSLKDKLTTFSVMIVDPTDYNFKVLDETDELLNWLDYLNDSLAIQFCQMMGLKTELMADLTIILRKIIDDVVTSTNHKTKPEKEKQHKLSFSVDQVDTKNNEIEAIHGKIKDLEDRTERLKSKDSSAVTALKHKIMYFRDRLRSIENLRTSMVRLRNKTDSGKMLDTVHMFEHLLPPQQRCCLIEKLLQAWTNAIVGSVPKDTNLISILSIMDMKAMSNDGVDTSNLNKNRGKIYVQHENGSVYQLDALNKFEGMCDDEKHMYFYDKCGRYYCNELNERIYTTLASEDCHVEQVRLRKLEERHKAREYLYDNLSRYSLKDNGINDGGMGDLVHIKSVEYVECPPQPSVIESSDYLKRVVGTALKKCIALVVLRQPEDPVKFLAKTLEDYRINEQIREAHRADEWAFLAEREARMCEAYEAPTAPATAASAFSGEREVSYADPNFVNYETIDTDFEDFLNLPT
ncbi:hypothetical protein O0L34_g7001 [Tuta absoluta]|nr:hypothetical protein O0L34_g7001 [Tuta absoluta]